MEPEVQLKPTNAVDQGDTSDTVGAQDVPDAAQDAFGGRAGAAPRDALEVARSESNIRAWRSYLPAECVDRMIEMGWDHST